MSVTVHSRSKAWDLIDADRLRTAIKTPQKKASVKKKGVAKRRTRTRWKCVLHQLQRSRYVSRSVRASREITHRSQQRDRNLHPCQKEKQITFSTTHPFNASYYGRTRTYAYGTTDEKERKRGRVREGRGKRGKEREMTSMTCTHGRLMFRVQSLRLPDDLLSCVWQSRGF